MSTMLKHFSKLGTPLRSALTYTGVHTQTQRFQEAGYSTVECLSLWDMWADPRFLSPSQRMQLDQVEPFDEWEEFAMFASHYAYIIAETCLEPLFPDLPPSMARRDSDVSNLSDMSARTASPYRADHEWFAFTYSPNPGLEGRTHHASAYLSPNEDAIAVTGGIGLKGRQATTSIYTAQDEANIRPALPSSEIGARCCHTITTLQNRQNLLIGGRTSPNNPLKDCWLQTGQRWERVHDLPEPRYRHRAACIILPDNTHGVIVFGGKTSATKVATQSLLWGPRDGWRRLRNLLHDPVPRFGPSFVRLGFNHGIMFGGMRQDGIVCQGLWRWRLMVHDGVITGIKFKTSTALDTTVGIYPWLGRLGASYSVTRNELLIIGGVAKAGCIPKEYEILSIVGSFSAYADHEKEMDLRVLCVSPRMEPGVPRPMLIGHSTHRTVHETSLIVGGGCTCFSFGAYWNAGAWLMHDRVQGIHKPWVLVKPPEAPTELQSAQRMLNGIIDTSPPAPIHVATTAVECEADFLQILRNGVPKIITDLDIGPCTKLWNCHYLKSKTAASRQVIVHSSPISTMNFQRKDSFNYTNLPLHTFLNILASSAKAPDLEPHMYLRSISCSSPNSKAAVLETDWPEIASDFKMPPSLSYISNNLHSSPLRISTNLSMWLHYDVMANVLFHVSSSPKPTPKILILFQPQDIKYLSFPPGSTTSTLDILPTSPPANADPRSRSQQTSSSRTPRPPNSGPQPNTPPYILNGFSSSSSSSTTPQSLNLPPLYLPPGTHPHLVALPPGAALYIPPLWAHTALPCPAGITNISVNTFFYSLPKQVYAAGRDVYGNRDLTAYEDGRRDIERMVKRFDTSGTSVAKGNKPFKSNQAGNANGDLLGPTATVTSEASTASATPSELAAQNDVQAEIEVEAGLQGMPKDIAKAYLERLAQELLEKAAAL
jgi:tRNA wybutosine-synthesizing protein 4